MKILTIAATPFFSDRGCHMRIYNEAKFLQKFGSIVKICTYHEGKNIDGLDIERIKKVRWYKRIAPGFSWGKLWLDIKLVFLCRRVIKSFQPNIIHAHLWEGLGVGYIANILAGKKIPIVFDLQGDLEEEFKNYNKKNFIARRIFVWLSKKFVGRCNWIVLSSQKMVKKIEKIFPHPNRIFVARDGIDTDLFSENPKITKEEERKIEEIKKWKGDKKLLVYIGGLSDSKGVGELLNSFSKIVSQPRSGTKKWKLLIGGFGHDEEKYKSYISKNRLENSVYFAGKVSYFSLPMFMSLADAAIDPKNGSSESSGKLVNLMAARLPIICFDNNFNRAWLGNKGYFMKTFSELEDILEKLNGEGRIEYDLENLSQENEIRKLMTVFRLLTK